MLLSDLHERLAPAFPAYARKDFQTAVRVLAKALQCTDPQHCPLDQFNRPLPSLFRVVENYLLAQGKGIHTLRNTKNNLSRLFRLAETHKLFSLVPLPLTPRYGPRKRAVRPGSECSYTRGTYLCYAQWPADLQAAFAEFATWGTAPLVPGRDASLRKRPVTMDNYRSAFEIYFGFLHRVEHVSPLTFDHLFDFALLKKFVYWHANECHKRPTKSLKLFLQYVLAITNQYRPMPELHTQVLALQRSIPFPEPTYHKEDAWVSLATLNEIGQSLWPLTRPRIQSTTRHPGSIYALRAGISLMLRLWTYIPYRQRNMREMLLGENLHKDSQGKWRITFRGEQLKIATRRGRTNIFDLPFPESLVPFLEDYLAHWRPILHAKHQQYAHVFLTKKGTPYTRPNLTEAIQRHIYSFTGRYSHPHIIRSVWATEWIRKTHGDFYTAAIMLNDTLETVIKKYAYLLEEDVAEKAYRLIDERNGAGK